MFVLGFCVFASILCLYLAWHFNQRAEKLKLQEWISLGSTSDQTVVRKTPLQMITLIFLKVFGFWFPKGLARNTARDKLVWAGWERFEVETYYSFRILLFMIPVFMYPMMMGGGIGWVMGMVAGAVLFMMPEFLLNYRMKQRNAKIEKELLPVTELLVTSTQAGLTIDQSIQRITRVNSGIFSNLLKQGYQYMAGVMTRADAFDWIIKQTNVESVHLFVEALAQSGKYGTSVSDILVDQLRRIRNEIENRGIQRAQAANNKMMIPTMIFIFLPLLVMIMGPIVMSAIHL